MTGEYAIRGGDVDAERIDSLARDTEAAARDPSTVSYQAQLYQGCGRRPVDTEGR